MFKALFSLLREYIKKQNEMAVEKERLQFKQQTEQFSMFLFSLLRKNIADAFNQLPEYMRLSYKVYPNSFHMNYTNNSYVASLRVSDASTYSRVKCHELVEELNNILKNTVYDAMVDFDNELSSINTYSNSFESYINYFSDYSYKLIFCDIVSISAMDNVLVLRFRSDFTKYNSYYPTYNIS